MKSLRCFLFVLVFASTWAYGQATSKASDHKAVLIVSQALQQMGADPLALVRDTECLVQVTTLRPSGRETKTATIRTLGDESLRVDADTGGSGDYVIVTTGGAKRKGSEGEEIVPSRAFGTVIAFHLPQMTLRKWIQRGSGDLTYVELKEHDGQKLHHIRWRPSLRVDGIANVDNAPVDVFVDAQTLLVSRLAFTKHAPSNLKVLVPVVVEYSNYKLAHGLLVPFDIRYFIRGKEWQRYVITDFKVNQGVSPAQFEVRQP